jgi:hypothetical protein
MAIEFVEANSIGVKLAGWLPMTVCDFCGKRVVDSPDQAFMLKGVVVWHPNFDAKRQAYRIAHRMCWMADEDTGGTRWYWDTLERFMGNLTHNITNEDFNDSCRRDDDPA